MSREICPFLNTALKAAEQLSRLWRIIWKNALRALFEYSLRFGIIRRLFSGEMATHRCQSTAEGEARRCDGAHKPSRMKNVNAAGALYFRAACLSHIIAADTFSQPFYLTFFFPFYPPPSLLLLLLPLFSLRASFKVILALHMAD